MKIRIEETEPGELGKKAEDVVRVIESLTGRDLLEKSEVAADREPRPSEWPALNGIVERSRAEVERLRAVMAAKLAAVLEA